MGLASVNAAQSSEAEPAAAVQCSESDFKKACSRSRSAKHSTFCEMRLHFAKMLSEIPGARERYLPLLKDNCLQIRLKFSDPGALDGALPHLALFKPESGRMKILLNEDCFEEQLILLHAIPELNEKLVENLSRAWLPVLIHELEHAKHHQDLRKDFGILRHHVPMEEELAACLVSASYAFQLRSNAILKGASAQEIAFFDKSNSWLWTLRPDVISEHYASNDGVARQFYENLQKLSLEDFSVQELGAVVRFAPGRELSSDQLCEHLKSHYAASMLEACEILNQSREAIHSQPEPADWKSILDSRFTPTP